MIVRFFYRPPYSSYHLCVLLALVPMYFDTNQDLGTDRLVVRIEAAVSTIFWKEVA